jgi:2-methylcitrate dehydratase PrpD
MVATALLRGRLSVAELDQDWRADPELAAMLARVRIVLADEAFSSDMIPEPGRVEVVLADGRRRTAAATRTPGHPDYPLDDAALRAKFLSCTRRLGEPRRQALLDALAHLDEADDVARIARLTVPS